MYLHEHYSKELLERYGLPIQKGVAVDTVSSALKAYKQLTYNSQSKLAVVKALILASGRGKGQIKGTQQRGVCIVRNIEEAENAATNMLGNTLITLHTGPEGQMVRKILIAEEVYRPGPCKIQELYMAILLDRKKNVHCIMYCPEGGMHIEEVVHNTPEKIFKQFIHPGFPLLPFQAQQIAWNLGLTGQAFRNMVNFVTRLYNVYTEMGCELIEINPLLKDAYDNLLVVNCRIGIEDNALVLEHPDLGFMRDKHEEDPLEVQASAHRLCYVKCDGNVACMANGAGLAMATMDMIKLSGGEPANFLDLGSNPDTKRVETGFRIILQAPKVKAVFINIFGGMLPCTIAAQGVIEACRRLGYSSNSYIPIIMRLQGNNADDACELIRLSGYKIQLASQWEEASALINRAVS